MMDFNKDMMEKIVQHKNLNELEFKKEWKKFMNYDCNTNKNSFCGNKLLYHSQMKELCNTKRYGKKSLYEICENEEYYNELAKQTEQRSRTGSWENRLFECWRINNGSITFFKPTQASYILKKYKATKVLDPTAGWGGRAMACHKLGIDYIGIDTNTNLKEGYKKLFGENYETETKIKMLWKSCLDVDYSKLDYDFCLTSPPYENIEIYSKMSLWCCSNDFYLNFLIPLLEKIIKYNKGYTVFNISPQMYKKLTEKYKFRKCKFKEDLKEQKNGKTPDNLYFW